jgi:hypothetical protein
MTSPRWVPLCPAGPSAFFAVNSLLMMCSIEASVLHVKEIQCSDMRCEDCDLLSFFYRSPTEYGIRNLEIIRELFGGEHGFAQLTNGQYATETLIRSVLKMES